MPSKTLPTIERTKITNRHTSIFRIEIKERNVRSNTVTVSANRMAFMKESLRAYAPAFDKRHIRVIAMHPPYKILTNMFVYASGLFILLSQTPKSPAATEKK